MSHRIWLALLLSLQLLPQIIIHRAVGLGTDIPGYLTEASQAGVTTGVAYGVSDAYTYASWAEQAAQGRLLMTDAYATEMHRAAFFNPYFIMCGLLARTTGLMPLTIISILGVLAGPILGLLAFVACREAGLTSFASILGMSLILFATGPSVLIAAANIILKVASQSVLTPGIDSSYFDLFPATTLLTAPYQSFCLALTSLGLVLAIRALHTAPSPTRTKRLLLTCIVIAIIELVRPYQCAGLAASFVLAVLASPLLYTKSRNRWKLDASIVAITLLPTLIYIGWMSHIDVWRDVARGYQLIHVAKTSIIVGFSVLWFVAVIGIVRALRAGSSMLILPALWSVTTGFITCVMGNMFLKFADGACIPLAILGGYGLEQWLRPFASSRHKTMRVIRYFIATIAIALPVGTTAYDMTLMLRMGMPEIDRDIVEAGLILRTQEFANPPLVLTECGAGNLLPGLANVNVYSGHWALTPDYRTKCETLAKSGIELTDAVTADRTTFDTLLAKLHPSYLLLRRSAPAFTWVADASTTVIWQSQRWTMFKL